VAWFPSASTSDEPVDFAGRARLRRAIAELSLMCPGLVCWEEENKNGIGAACSVGRKRAMLASLNLYSSCVVYLCYG
jgi:hypothetical protein